MKKLLTFVVSAVALLGAIAAPAFASSTFHLVVPLSRAVTTPLDPAAQISVTLAGVALPKAIVGTRYGQSLHDYLTITGDSSLDKSATRWDKRTGVLPSGLVFDETTGVLSGVPTAETTNPANFSVRAVYKGVTGEAEYTIEVGGVLVKVRQIVAGENYACAITAAGAAKCWGYNAGGQLGDGTTALAKVPVGVVGLESGVKSLAVGVNHTCAIMEAGNVKCWGYNANGQLGDGTVIQQNSPVELTALAEPVENLALGHSFTCALLTDKSVKCWGVNNFGQLGDGTFSAKTTPVVVQGLEQGVASISSGTRHTCAVTTDGVAKCWGRNEYGQLGDGTSSSRSVPVTVAGLDSGVVDISAGLTHTCAVLSGGAVKCWGYNNYGQLGDNTQTTRTIPVYVVNLESGAAKVDAGGTHTCAVTPNGGVKCWGRNDVGSLGDGTLVTKRTPVDVLGLSSGVLTITTGSMYSCATTSDKAYCWGDGRNGEIGDGTAGKKPQPVELNAFN